MILFINACIRKNSRTKQLADHLINKFNEPIEEINLLDQHFPFVDEDFLNTRDALLKGRNYDNPLFAMARQFSEADRIIVAAPYYDLSFPASLKQYFEQINCVGITFKYAPEGYPIPLCNAKQLIYVMSAGGEFVPEEFGFGYVKSLAENFYGIKDVRLVKAVGLDIDGADVDKIMEDAMKQIDNCFAQ